jgi:hypothetical protein
MELSSARWKSVKSSKSGFSTLKMPVIWVIRVSGYQVVCIRLSGYQVSLHKAGLACPDALMC